MQRVNNSALKGAGQGKRQVEKKKIIESVIAVISDSTATLSGNGISSLLITFFFLCQI